MHLKVAASLLFAAGISMPAQAQRWKAGMLTLSISNNQTAKPFAKGIGLITEEMHPGVEVGYTFNWRSRAKSDIFQGIHLGYFYHRFAQSALPLYTTFGYRYRPLKRLHAEVALGAGYFHAIPATAVLRADKEGNYERSKGIGRPQAMIQLGFGAGYLLNPAKPHPWRVSLHYIQRIQTPFVPSYVPLLPYNVLQVGLGRNITFKK